MSNDVRDMSAGEKRLGIQARRSINDPSSAYEDFYWPAASRDGAGQARTRLLRLIKDGVTDSGRHSRSVDRRKCVQGRSGCTRKGGRSAAARRAAAARADISCRARAGLLGTERYALGPEALQAALHGLGIVDTEGLVKAAGFTSSAEAMAARYSDPGKGSGILLLLEYPTPQLAEQHIHHLDEVLSAAAKQAGTVIERKGSLLSMVLAPSSAEYAKSLNEAANYETQVTWNEASQAATDPPITSTLVKIIMGTGVFMVAAIVLGIAFGGVRVVTKKFFPGKVFDRANQMEVLQLGLSGKRIDPSDFY